jgi:4-amino-4-deoxy-L-arabinose transferase-like glycosyltransferase
VRDGPISGGRALANGEIALVITALLYVVFSRRWTLGESALWLIGILLIPLVSRIVFLIQDQKQANRQRAACGVPD